MLFFFQTCFETLYLDRSDNTHFVGDLLKASHEWYFRMALNFDIYWDIFFSILVTLIIFICWLQLLVFGKV